MKNTCPLVSTSLCEVQSSVDSEASNSHVSTYTVSFSDDRHGNSGGWEGLVFARFLHSGQQEGHAGSLRVITPVIEPFTSSSSSQSTCWLMWYFTID